MRLPVSKPMDVAVPQDLPAATDAGETGPSRSKTSLDTAPGASLDAKMDFPSVIKAMRIINPGGDNEAGNCTTCSFDTASALISGETPSSPSSYEVISLAMEEYYPKVKSFPLAKGGAENVFEWLNTEAEYGVYLFDSEDHMYNVVKSDAIYVIDSNLQFFSQLESASDAIHTHEGGEYHYLDPDPDEDANPEHKFVTVHYCGALHENWQRSPS